MLFCNKGNLLSFYNQTTDKNWCFTKTQMPMNESYTFNKPYTNKYVSLDYLNDIVRDLDDMEDDIFGSIDSMLLTPSQDTMNKIYAYL